MRPSSRRTTHGLGLGRLQARTLRAGPIVALLASLLGAGVLAITLAFHPPQPKTQAGAEPSLLGASAAAGSRRQLPKTRSRPGPRRASHRRMRRSASAPGGRPPPRIPSDLRSASSIGRRAAPGSSSSRRRPARRSAPNQNRPTSRAPRSCKPRVPPPRPSIRPTRNFQGRKNAFLGGKGGAATADYLAAPMMHPRSSPTRSRRVPFFPRSSSPPSTATCLGPVIAQVREHVYDTVTGETTACSSRRAAACSPSTTSMVAWGQERVLVCWNRLCLAERRLDRLAVHACSRPRRRRRTRRSGR